MVPCKYVHYCIALLFVCCIFWAPPYANAQRFDVRPRGDIARHQRYIPVLQALDKAAEEAVQACQTSNDQMTCAMAQMAIQAFHAGNQAAQDCLGGDEEACNDLDQAVAMLGGQPSSSVTPRQSPMQRFSGGDRAMSCDDYRVQYETCKAQVRSVYGPYRPGAIGQRRAANAQCRAILEAAATVCQGGGIGGGGGGGDTCLDRCRQYSFRESRCTPEHPDGNIYDGGPSRAGDRKNCRDAAIQAQEDCLRSCR